MNHLASEGASAGRSQAAGEDAALFEVDEEYDRDYDGCDHEDYDIDILDGRARCDRCGESWYATNDEILRVIDCMSAHDRWEEEQNRRQWWRDLWHSIRSFFRRKAPRQIYEDDLPF